MTPQNRLQVEKIRSQIIQDIIDYEERRKSPGLFYVRKTAEGVFSIAALIIKGIGYLIVATLAPILLYQCQHLTDDGVPGYHPPFQDDRYPSGR